MGIGLQAIQLSPYHTGLAKPRRKRLLPFPALSAYSCPLALSGSSEPLIQGSPLNPSHLRWGCCMTYCGAPDAGGSQVPGKGTGSPAPSPQTRTSAMNASGSSVTTSLRQWRTTQATPRLAHNCADPGPAILWSFMDTVGEPGVSPLGPPRETLCPALPSLQWVPWVAVPHLPRYYAPLRLPPARLGSLRLALASRYRACFMTFVVSPSGS